MEDYIDSVARLLPLISSPAKKQTPKEKLAWSAAVLLVFLVMQFIRLPVAPYLTAAAPLSWNLLLVGFGPILIVYAWTLVFTLLGWLRVDSKNIESQLRLQRKQKLIMVFFAFFLSFTFAAIMPATSNPVLVFFELFLASVAVIYMDELSYKYGITSGVNLFLVASILSSFVGIVGRMFLWLSPGTMAGTQALASLISYLVVVGLVSFFAIELVRSRLGWVDKVRGSLGVQGERWPINLLFVQIAGRILGAYALSLILGIMSVIPLNFIAYRGAVPAASGAGSILVGGLVYLLSSSNFPLPWPTTIGGIGGQAQMVTYLYSHTSQLLLPGGTIILVPELVHIIASYVLLALFSIIFTNLWVKVLNRQYGIALKKEGLALNVALLVLLGRIEDLAIGNFGIVNAALISYVIYADYRKNRKG